MNGLTPYALETFKGGKPTEKQALALDAALNTPDIAIIIGPPGTGKTQVIAALQNDGTVLTFDQVGIVSMFFWTGLFTYYYPNGNQVTIDNLAPGDYGVEAYPFDANGMGAPPITG